MLAQLNSKQKSIFFNIKPTVIDKLISKNKSSIQNSLLYTNEESDGSLSEDSEESSLSSPENSVIASALHPAVMAPIRRSEKINVLGSKLAPKSQFPIKRKPGRPPLNKVGGSSALKVMAAKKLLENSKRASPKTIVKNVNSCVKMRRNASDNPEKSKRSRLSLKAENIKTVAGSTTSSESAKSIPTQRKLKGLKDLKASSANESKTSQKSPLSSQPSTLGTLPSKSSPRKFPSNIMDRWKSTGLVIRGRGRPRGSTRGSMRGGMRRGGIRPERYNTRDSQTGLMRSGKRRNCSDPSLVEGLAARKKRRVLKQVKVKKSDWPSDEHSSFVTTSELSFCDNDNSMKQSDDETVNLRSVKVEVEETEDEASRPTDSNSNVFNNNDVKERSITASSGSDTNDQSNKCKVFRQNKISSGPIKFGRGRKRLISLGKRVVPQSDSSVRDSDCSLDSDFTEDLSNSPKSGLKRHRRKGVDGLWVRRSTRSIGKGTDKAEPDAVVIEELLKEKDFVLDVDSNSKSSLNVDTVTNCDSSLQSFDTIEKRLNESNDFSRAVTETPEEKCSNVNSFIDCPKSEEKMFPILDMAKNLPETDLKTCVKSGEIIDNDLNDFTLALEETPVKNSDELSPKIKSGIPAKSLFDSSEADQDISTSSKVHSDLPLISESNETTPLVIEDFSEEQKSESVCSTFQSEDFSDLPKCESNNTCKLVNIVKDISDSEQIRNFKNFDKSSETDDANLNDRVEPVDSSIGQCDAKTNDPECSRDLISDEKILSLIDSFCQSDSTDLSVDERIHEPTPSIPDEEQIILDSVNEITAEVESKLLEEDQGDDLRDKTINHLEKTKSMSSFANDDFLPEMGAMSSTCKSGEVETSNEALLSHPNSNESIVNKTVREDEESVSSLKLQNMSVMNVNENLQADCCYDDLKMEDLENVDKAPESTEESSSSDSNSNMSELMSTPLENDVNIPEKGSSVIAHSNEDCGMIGTLQVLENKGDGNEASSESKTCSTTIGGSFSLLMNEKAVSNSEETNKGIVCSKNRLSRKSSVEESTDEGPSKELLRALGLQSSHSVADEKPKRPTDNYTGTLKAVIKLNRSSDKKSGGRKMIFKQGDKLVEDSGGGGDRLEYRICSAEELATEGVPLTHLADIPANRKTQMKVKSQFDLSNSPNIVGAAGSMETPATTDATKETGTKTNLIIPEKSSSFSIHPERLCTDVCSYCFGKFGSLDTPCHLAQLKNSERQAKILAIEVHLSVDSCLCDGCFRYVDRKANCPTAQRSRKPAARRGPLAGTVCAVQNCTQPARHSVRRKWLIKLKKSIGKKLVVDMDKNPHLPLPLCSQHYYWVDYFTVCGICKKRLTRNHMYALGPEADELNQALSDDGIPVRLSDKLFLCKLCRYYSSLRLKYRDPAAMSAAHQQFLNSYRKKILRYHDIPVSDSEEEGKSVEEDGSTSEVQKTKKKKSKSKSLDGHESKKRTTDKEEKSDPGNEDRSNDSQMIDYSYLETLNVHREESTPPTVDYSSLAGFEGGFSNIASLLNPLEGGQGTVYPSDSQNRARPEKPTRIQVKFGNLNIGKLSNLNIGQDTRPASAAPPVERPPYLPGERDMKLSGEIEFHGTLNPSSSWERCTSTIQFDRDTKKLWQDLQRPYGNQSSFLRHLVILEKHWRNGSLVLAEDPNPRAVKYLNSVRNRVQAYDGGKSSDVPVEKPKQLEVPLISPPPRPMSTPVKTTGAPPPLMRIAPGSVSWSHEQLRKPPPYNPLTSPQTSTTTSRLMPISAPPPYRFPLSRTNQLGPRTIRLPIPNPTHTQPNRGPPNPRPVSISYQQFKKIRLEKPPSTASQVTVVSKEQSVETLSALTPNTSNPDFIPLICDVRSLATSSTTDWNESFRKQQQKLLKQNVAKYYTPILPKIPNSLTVTTFPKTSSLVMKTSSLTIEKAPNVSAKPSIAPPEKPSISVFRETTSSENC